MRALKLSLEERYGVSVPADHFIIPWLANYAAFAINRFEVGSDGMTPFQRLRGKPFTQSMCEFGECLHALSYKQSGVKHKHKLQSRWYDGVFVGFYGQTNEFLIGTPDGIRRARTVKRKPIPERWDIAQLNAFKGLPPAPEVPHCSCIVSKKCA